VIAGNPVEIKPRLVESVVRAGGKLQGLEERGPTLEDLFLRLTGAIPEPDPAAGARTADQTRPRGEDLPATPPDDPEEGRMAPRKDRF